jgi:NAD(P)H-dependent FMN reductase
LKPALVQAALAKRLPVGYSKKPASSGGKYENNIVKAWAAKIEDGDAFIVVTPEYNHGYPAVLKNALDSIFPEWNLKPIGFVSYGNAGGARSVELLRQVVVELLLLPMRPAIHIPSEITRVVMKKTIPVDPELFKALRSPVDRVEIPNPADDGQCFLRKSIIAAKRNSV